MQAAGEPRTHAAAPGAGRSPHRPNLVRAVLPLVLGGTIALLPSPEGLEPTAWLYFAVFVTVIAGVITEPLAPAALGLAGVTVAAAFGLVRDNPSQSAQWALSGFANPAVWLIFAAYMLTLGYAATGLGKRIALQLVRIMGHRTLGLGYAVTLADLTLAPFTASATARSGGTIYPVIRHIPELYQSHPDDRSSRRIGGYLLYTAMAASFITSSMFITALAPNALAISIIEQVTGVRIAWMDWFIGFAPVGITLLAIVPALLYRIYPPQVRRSPEARIWAGDELRLLGPMKRSELTLLLLVVLALALWIGAADAIDPALAAIVVVVLMVGCRVVSWEDVIGNAPAWNVLIWFGTLVTLAGGLGETGFMEWLARTLAPAFTGLGYYTSIVAVVGAFFFLHYFFASITAHTATLLPVFLAIAVTLPGPSPVMWALLLGYSLGLMSVLTSYAAGQNVIYYSSGYIARRDFWLLGFVMGLLFLATYVLIGIPWLQFLGV
jgi:L-tartrate/succinate antiporter